MIALEAYLRGLWRLERRIDDRRAGLVGTLSGAAEFAPDGAGLKQSERGRLRFGDHEGEAAQSYLWRFPGPQKADVFFADGRFFVALDFSGGPAAASHLCGADLYEGEARLIGPDEWRLIWRVGGPRKDYLSESRFLRAQ